MHTTEKSFGNIFGIDDGHRKNARSKHYDVFVICLKYLEKTRGTRGDR